MGCSVHRQSKLEHCARCTAWRRGSRGVEHLHTSRRYDTEGCETFYNMCPPQPVGCLCCVCASVTLPFVLRMAGHFGGGAAAEPTGIICSLHPSGTLRMELPFAAGGCNEGVAGVQPVALQRCVEHRQLRGWAAADSANESRLLSALGIGQRAVYPAILGKSEV